MPDVCLTQLAIVFTSTSFPNVFKWSPSPVLSRVQQQAAQYFFSKSVIFFVIRSSFAKSWPHVVGCNFVVSFLNESLTP